MDEGFSFTAGIFLMVGIFIFGPTVRGVDADMWSRAEQACAPVGGVKSVEPVTFYNRYEVVCNNEMSINLPRSNG